MDLNRTLLEFVRHGPKESDDKKHDDDISLLPEAVPRLYEFGAIAGAGTSILFPFRLFIF